MLKMILCVDKDFGIAKDGKMAWDIKEEMEHFKNTTLNKTVVMGRRTFESMNKKLLPLRKNIILSKQKKLKIDGAQVTHDINYIIKLAKSEDVFIIGGKQTYELFIDHVNEIVLSKLNNSYNCDLFYQPNLEQFKLINEDRRKTFSIFYYKKNK